MGELQSLLNAQRSESTSRFSDVVSAKEAALARCSALERELAEVVSDREQQTVVARDQEAKLEQKLSELRTIMSRKGERIMRMIFPLWCALVVCSLPFVRLVRLFTHHLT